MNPLTKAWQYLSQPHPAVQQKFRLDDPTQNWQRINSLVYGGGIRPDLEQRDGNSAVFACLMALSLSSIEPPLAVFKKDVAHGGELEPQPDNPLQVFLDDPNPWLDMLELRFWTSWARHVDGNAYLVKVRSGNDTTGNVVQLWPVSPLAMRPARDKGSSEFITHYEHDVGARDPERIPVENVIHFRLGIDDHDMRKGLAPIKRLVREIASDEEATKFTEALLQNFGIPGLVVQVPQGTALTEDQAMTLKQRIQQAYGGDNRGGVGVLTGGASMQQFGFSPDQLNLSILHGMPETRICAVMGIPPAIAGLTVGLEQTANYASMKQVRENFTEVKLAPMWRLDEAKWNKRLRADFTSDKTIVIKHDLSEVRALQEDENARHQRVREDYRAGVITQQMALRELGYDAELNPDETLMLPPGTSLSRVADAVPEPGALPPALLPPDPNALPPGQDAQNTPGKTLTFRNGRQKADSEADEVYASLKVRRSTVLSQWPELLDAMVEMATPALERDFLHWQNGVRDRAQAQVNGNGVAH